jgi:hypothetical protein
MPDVITQIYPWKKVTIDMWKNGIIPLWNPYSFAGTPQAANYQSAVFSPVNLLFLIFPFIDAWSFMILLQPVIAGVGMYLYLRKISGSHAGPLLGAIGFMFCAFMTTWMAYGTLSYAIGLLPWILWCITSDFQKESIVRRLILSALIAFSFVSGHFQISLYVLGMSIFYILFESLSKKKIKQGMVLFIYVIGGVMLAAPQLLLTFDAYNASTRSISFVKGEVIPWQYIVTVLSPDFFGNPVTRNDWFGHYAEWGSYIGVIPLFLAMLAVVYNVKGYKKFFITTGILSILLAYPTPLNDLLFRLKIPAISTSAASRIIVLLSFSLATLSALGFDALLEYWKTNNKKPLIIASGIAVGVVGLLWMIVYVIKPFSSDRLVVAERNLILPSMLVVIASVAICFGLLKYRMIRILALISIIALTVFDVYRFSSKWMPFDPPEYVYPQVSSLTFLASRIGSDRVFGNIGNEVGSMFSLPLIEGYDAMYQGRYAEFINATSRGIVAAGDRSVVQFDKNGTYKTEALQLLGVRYIYHRISDGQNVWAFPYWEYLADSSMRSIYRDDQYEIFEFTKVFPRTFLASSYTVETDKQKIIDALFSKNLDRREQVVLEERPAIEPLAGAGKAEIISYTANHIRIHTDSQVPKLLFLSDVYDPGWHVTIDGRESEIYRADYDFRAVAVPQGVHSIDFSYVPSSFVRGIIISLLAFTGIVLGVLCKKRI